MRQVHVLSQARQLTLWGTIIGILVTLITGGIATWNWYHGLEDSQQASAHQQAQRQADFQSWRAVNDVKIANLQTSIQWQNDKIWELSQRCKP